MSQYSQQQQISACRVELDDGYDSKLVFQFSPLQGELDGANTQFQIPQSRVVVYPSVSPTIFPQVFKNNEALDYGTDYTLTKPKQGILTYLNDAEIPKPGDSQTCTFNWTWFDDTEFDQFLTDASNEIGYTTYYTTASNIPNTIAQPISGGTIPTDIPDGLKNAIVLLGASKAAKSLANRFAMKYDISAGDQSFSPSQMSKQFGSLAASLSKLGYNARDDYYKGQGRQYSPAMATNAGYVLPDWTPKR